MGNNIFHISQMRALSSLTTRTGPSCPWSNSHFQEEQPTRCVSVRGETTQKIIAVYQKAPHHHCWNEASYIQKFLWRVLSLGKILDGSSTGHHRSLQSSYFLQKMIYLVLTHPCRNWPTWSGKKNAVLLVLRSRTSHTFLDCLCPSLQFLGEWNI